MKLLSSTNQEVSARQTTIYKFIPFEARAENTLIHSYLSFYFYLENYHE